MNINIYNDKQALLTALADHIISAGAEAIAQHDQFNWVLSGGNSPKELYALLASGKYKNQLRWDKVYFFFGDERHVPVMHADSNANMVKKELFEPLEIHASQIFIVNTSLSPGDTAKAYASAIQRHFGGGEIVFDLILLGLGDNAHTASLFPHTPVLDATDATIEAVYLPEENKYRVTMTAPLINQARQIAFLVYGSNKAEAVAHVLEYAYEPHEYPAQLIQPTSGEVNWYIDEAAAALLKK